MELLDIAVALLTLIALEVILGIDNIIFISIISDKLPEDQRDRLRYWGLGLAMVMRLALLTVISWIMKLQTTLFTVYQVEISGKDIILILGGIFLIVKSTREIYENTEEHAANIRAGGKKPTFKNLLIEVLLLDMVFSIDSIITAVGLVDQLWIMYTAVIITVLIMLVASGPISRFITKHPSFKILALCFLMMIGVALVAEGLDFKIPKGYIYFSMAFAFIVDIIQMKTIKPRT